MPFAWAGYCHEPNGNPCVNTTVRARNVATDQVVATVRTNQDGKYVVPGLDPTVDYLFETLSRNLEIDWYTPMDAGTIPSDISVSNITVSGAVKGAAGSNLTLSSDASIIAMIDADNNDTNRAFVVRSNGSATNIFTVDEAGNVIANGNLTFGATGQRITGDFSNGTHANRVLVQTSTANSNTILGVLPAGTGTAGSFLAYAGSDPTSAVTVSMTATTAGTQLNSSSFGVAAQPLTIIEGGTSVMRFHTSLGISLLDTTDPGVGAVRVAGALTVTGGLTVGSDTAAAPSAYVVCNGAAIQTKGLRLLDAGVITAGFQTTSTASYIDYKGLLSWRPSPSFPTTLSLSVAGILSLVNTLTFTANGTPGPGSVYKDAAFGLVVYGVTGSSYDLLLANNAGSAVLAVPTGTRDILLGSGIVNAGANILFGRSNTSVVVDIDFDNDTTNQIFGVRRDATTYIWQITEAGLMSIYQVPEARVTHNANVPVGASAQIMIPFNTETGAGFYDTDGIHDPVTNNSRLTCRTAGKYLIVGSVRWASNASGTVREIALWQNTTVLLSAVDLPASGNAVYMTITAVADLAVNDYVEMSAYQDTAITLNIIAASGSPCLSMTRIG